MSRSNVLPILIFMIGAPMLWMSVLRIGDSDPRNFYKVLNLPQGVPHRISSEQIQAAYEQAGEAARLQIQTECTPKQLLQDDENTQLESKCKALHSDLDLMKEAAKVLLDADARDRYDHPEKYAKTDYFEVLGVERNATIADMAAAYKHKMNELKSREEGASCSDAANREAAVCAEIEAQKRDLTTAAEVLGNEDNRRVYVGTLHEHAALSFVSNPLLLVQGAKENPMQVLAPLLTLLGVLFYIQNVERGWRGPLPDKPAEAEEGEEGEGEDEEGEGEDEEEREEGEEGQSGTARRRAKKKEGYQAAAAAAAGGKKRQSEVQEPERKSGGGARARRSKKDK